MEAAAFSPCNITGFFRIHDGHRDRLIAGSTGASVAISSGVVTRVRSRRSSVTRTRVTFNGKPLPMKSVSNHVINEYSRLTKGKWNFTVDHRCQLPMGCGYGTSGAGALSLSLALNEIMGVSLSPLETARLAHISEIACRTGLGTVASVFAGGLTLRLGPGAPGIGQVRKIQVSSLLRVVSATFGPISTPQILSNLHLRDRINKCGKRLIWEFQLNQSQTSFVTLSRQFSNCLNLTSPRLSSVIRTLDRMGFASSMMMMGESLFCLVNKDLAPAIGQMIRRRGLTPFISTITRYGARLQ